MHLAQVAVKSQDYQGILEPNVLPSGRKFGLSRRSWALKQDNDPKHTAKNIGEWPRIKRWTVLKWPSVIPDLSLIVEGPETCIKKSHKKTIKKKDRNLVQMA